MNASFTLSCIALGGFALVWALHFVFQKGIKLSIEIEEEKLARSRVPHDVEHIKALGVLRSLEVTSVTIFTAFLPIAGLVLGNILPDPARTFLSNSVGPASIIAVSIAVLFAYAAAYRMWSRYMGDRIWERIREMLLGKENGDPPAPPPPTSRPRKTLDPAVRQARRNIANPR